MDAAEFKKIFLPCHRRMYATAWRLTGNAQQAEDLVQDTLLKLWTKRDDLTIPDNAEAFSVTSLRNLFYDQQRKKHLQENDEEPQEYQLCTEHDQSDELELREQAVRVQQIIDNLPEKQRMVITMHDIDNLSYEEIKTLTGLNYTNIRVALSRARKAVREKLRRYPHND